METGLLAKGRGRSNSNKPPKAAWKLVCLPKEEGGLGVIDLRVQNEALLLKRLHKFFNKEDLPWVNLVWDNYYRNGKAHSGGAIF
jgi:hypothetical protein